LRFKYIYNSYNSKEEEEEEEVYMDIKIDNQNKQRIFLKI